MKKTIAFCLLVVMAFGFCPCGTAQTESNDNQLWHICAGGDGNRSIEISDGKLTYTDPYNSSTTFDYETTKDGKYTYYYVDEAEIAFVIVNNEMIAQLNYADDDDASFTTPSGLKFEQYINMWGFKEGSEDSIPANIDRNMANAYIEELFNDLVNSDPFVYSYYAQSKMLVASNKYVRVSFYVASDGSLTYVEGISLANQAQGNNVIVTDANYVIVDTK